MPKGTAPHFAHSAFLHDGDHAYVELVGPFLCEGLEQDEAVAVSTGPHRAELIRVALGGDAERVRFLPADEWFVRPARTIGAWAQLMRAATRSGRPAMRVVNELPVAVRAEPTWVRFEAALNAALAGHPAHVLCPYDRSAAGTARRTHHLVHDAGWHTSDDYVAPEELLTGLPEPAYPVSGPPVLSVPVVDTVIDLRGLVRDRALREGWLAPDRVESLILAISETTTNAIRYGGPHRMLSVWLTPEAVVCEVGDDGGTPPGPLAGYLPPEPGAAGGMGLWLVAQLSDALSVATEPTRARFAMLR